MMTESQNDFSQTTAAGPRANSSRTTTPKPQIIFFGNGPLAAAALEILSTACDIIFHAKTKNDLETVKQLKQKNPSVHGVLASYGVLIKSDVLALFEPEGILNIHPSLLPKYRGPSPIETAIKNGDTTFGVSVMKLVKAMDAGPIYHQTELTFPENIAKSEIYDQLAKTGAIWIRDNLEKLAGTKKTLNQLIIAEPQEDKAATYTEKLDKSISPLDPSKKSAKELQNEIRAYQGFPKSKYEFYGQDCAIIESHVATPDEAAATASQNTSETNVVSQDITPNKRTTLFIQCYDNSILIIDQLQPSGRKVMDAKSFLNGYAKKS